MGLAIIMRRREKPNWFRELLVGAIGQNIADNAILCSGFFQENFRNSKYKASKERDFAKVVSASGIELTTVGVHSGTWKPSYTNFRKSLRKAGCNVTCLYKNGLRWHAKIFVLSKSGTPFFGIIGSSNITRPAFGISKPFNYECDVYLWSDKRKRFKRWIESRLNEERQSPEYDPHDVIVADYEPDVNDGLTIEERLKALQAEVLENTFTEV